METEVHWTTDWLCPFLRGFVYADLLLIAKHFWYTHQMRKKPAAEFFLNSFFLFESGQFEHGLFTCTAPKSASTWRKELGQRWTPRGKPKSVHIYHTSDKGRLTASWKALIPFESIVMCRWILAWTHNWFFIFFCTICCLLPVRLAWLYKALYQTVHMSCQKCKPSKIWRFI